MANNSNKLHRYYSSPKLFFSCSKKVHLSSGKFPESIILSVVFTVVVILISFSSNLILTVQSQSLSGDNGEDDGNDYLLDERFPTVISNLYPNGEKDSLFGAAVSLMNYSQDYTWILIGEPKGNLSGNSHVHEPGVIWRCELGFGFERRRAGTGGWSEYCKIIEGDNSTGNQNNPVQATENSWFGGSMSVIESSAKTGAETSPQLIACSHRHGLSKAMPMSGACYFFKADGLNRRRINSKTPRNFKLNVVANLTPSDDQFEILDTSTNNTYTGTGHKYSHAAFGMSINIKGDRIFVGKPGPSRNRVRDKIFSSSIATYDVGKLLGTGTGTGSETETGTGTGTGPTAGLKNNQAEQQPYYYGYAVTSGNYYNRSSATSDEQTPTHFASGSPRENYVKGAVRISATKALLDFNSSEPVYQEVISGFHIGSYFGSVLYSQDIDGDGRDELFVGAPNTGKLLSRFFSKQLHPFLIEESTVNPNDEDDDKDIDPYFTTNPYYDGDRGCVYVYQSKDGKLKVIQILIGNNEAFSRFGSSISSIEHPRITEGISKKYILIGAPYENENTGAIYFYDTQTLMKSRKFSKRISASQLNSIIPSTSTSPSKLFQGFGVSFSNSVDVDGNKTPDLLVGSHLSKNVILFRTRHQIEITKQTMRISTGNKEILLEDFSKSELDKTTQLFILSVDVEYILLNTPSENKRENIQFWNRLQIDTAETKGRYTVEMQHHSERAVSNLTRIDNQTLEFSYFSLRQSSPSDPNAITETINIKTDFYVTLNENYADTEAPRGIEMKLQTWCDETKILEKSRMDYDIIQEQGVNMDPLLKKSQQTDMFRPFLPAPTYTNVLTTKIPLRQAVCRKPQCVPLLSISNVHFATIDGPRSERLEGNRFIIGSASNIVLKWTIKNAHRDDAESEPALFPGVFIKYGRLGEDHRSRGRDDEEIPDAINLTNWSLLSKDNSHCHSHNVPLLSPQEFWLSCNHSGVLPTNRNLTMQVKLNMTGIFPGRMEQKLQFTIVLTHNHSNSDPTEELGEAVSTTVSVELTLLADAMVSIVGVKRISTQNIRDAENKGTVVNNVNHNYLVSLTGESPVNRISLEFFVPVMRESDAANLTLVNMYHPTLTTQTNNANQNQGNKVMESEFECKIDSPLTSSALVSATTSKVLGSGTESLTSPSDVDVNGSGRRIPLPGVGSGRIGGLKDPSTTKPTGSFILSDQPEDVLEFDATNNPESTRTKEPLKYEENSTLLLSCSYPVSASSSSSGGVSKPKPSVMTGVTCLHIKCNILKVNKGAHFRILFSLRLSSDDESIKFLSADPSRNEILIQSTGMATILSRITSENHSSLATAQNKIKMMEIQVVVHEKEPIWIYVVAVIGGIIFLLALVFGLYKCGFFKRDMKVQMDSAQGIHGAVVYNNTATDDEDKTHRIRIQNLEDSPERANETSRFLS